MNSPSCSGKDKSLVPASWLENQKQKQHTTKNSQGHLSDHPAYLHRRVTSGQFLIFLHLCLLVFHLDIITVLHSRCPCESKIMYVKRWVLILIHSKYGIIWNQCWLHYNPHLTVEKMRLWEIQSHNLPMVSSPSLSKNWSYLYALLFTLLTKLPNSWWSHPIAWS